MAKRIFTLYNDVVGCSVVIEATHDEKMDWLMADHIMNETIGDLKRLDDVVEQVRQFPSKVNADLHKAIIYEDWRLGGHRSGAVAGWTTTPQPASVGLISGSNTPYPKNLPKHQVIKFKELSNV